MSTVALPRPVSAPALPARAETVEYVRRFDVHQRIQHVLMFTSFTVLAVTGLPQMGHTRTAGGSLTTLVSRWISDGTRTLTPP